MSDFDFDELDKAVTGALGNTDDVKQSAAPAKEVPKPTETASPSTPAPAARRVSTGRFMDVVHPSSDMRSSNAAPVAPKTTISAGATPSLPKPPVLYPTPASDIKTDVTQKVEASGAEDWSKPLESPFLPDAKVEKRPLGGFGTPELEHLDAESVPDFDLFAGPKDELLEAPDEPLLEATTLPDPIDFAAANEEKEEKEAPKLETEEKEVTPEVEPAGKPETSFAPSPDEVGPISITQQYKEQPSAEQESGAIFDTEAYHQPVAAPAKKRSGAWTILWIVLLIIFGAGVGAALYFYVIPSL